MFDDFDQNQFIFGGDFVKATIKPCKEAFF
jgi:hypothetical protein